VIWLGGEHDVSTVALVRESLTGVISGGNADVVVDLKRVTFIDASVIGALLDGREALARQSRRFALRSPSMCAMHVLTLCGLTGLVESAPSLTHERTSEKT
jgi:anti-anti-sigma factor